MAFCHITTRVEGEKHADLLSQKGGRGFPHIVFMDAEGKVLAEHRGARDAAGFSATGEKALSFIALSEKAAAGDKDAQAGLLLAQLERGDVKADEAEAKAAAMKLSDAQKKALGEALVNARVLEIARGARSQEDSKKAGMLFLDMHKAGKPAPTSEEAVQPYWILMMNQAEALKDVETFEAGLKALRARFGSNPQAAGFFKKQDATLERLKAEQKK